MTQAEQFAGFTVREIELVRNALQREIVYKMECCVDAAIEGDDAAIAELEADQAILHNLVIAARWAYRQKREGE